LSRGCNGRKNTPPQANDAVRGVPVAGRRAELPARWSGYLVQTGLAPAVMLFNRASIHGCICVGSGA